jgi:diadenosine tetraphosphate (Ap4A) HIT family hydrolase
MHGIFATLDIHPATIGHLLVTPEEPIGDWIDLPPWRLAQIGHVAAVAGKRIRHLLEPQRVVSTISGFGEPEHVHMHVVPSYHRGDIRDRLFTSTARLTIEPLAMTILQQMLSFPPELAKATDQTLTELLPPPNLKLNGMPCVLNIEAGDCTRAWQTIA